MALPWAKMVGEVLIEARLTAKRVSSTATHRRRSSLLCAVSVVLIVWCCGVADKLLGLSLSASSPS